MNQESKLKQVNGMLIVSLTVIASILAISVFALTDAMFSDEERSMYYGLIWLGFMMINLTIWMIRKDLVSLIFIFITITMAVSYLIDYKGVFITVPLLSLFGAFGYVIYLNSRLSRNYRRLLELTAQPVIEKNDGFSARPYPAGTIDYNDAVIRDFAGFLRKELIAIPYFDADDVMFTIKEYPRLWFIPPDPRRDSYVHFRSNGDISVNITRKEYDKYDAEYSFDELCHSLASLFRQLYEDFGKGQPERVKERFSE